MVFDILGLYTYCWDYPWCSSSLGWTVPACSTSPHRRDAPDPSSLSWSYIGLFPDVITRRRLRFVIRTRQGLASSTMSGSRLPEAGCQLLQSIALLQLLSAWDPKRGLQRKRAARLKCWQSRWSGVSLGEKGAKFSPIAVGNGKSLKEAELPLCPAAAPCSRVTAVVMHGSW